jgi:hypothetical protein
MTAPISYSRQRMALDYLIGYARGSRGKPKPELLQTIIADARMLYALIDQAEEREHAKRVAARTVALWADGPLTKP